ncbi:hypothetical protein Tco_1242637, partial [Tanacetum coccineum]
LDDTSANIIRDSPSPADAETGARSDKRSSGSDTEIVKITEELGEDVEKQENIKEKTMELDQDQAGSDPGETLESRPQPEQVHMKEDQAGPDPGISRVALSGPDPEPTHDEFIADLYPKVQESLKFPADKHVILEDPLRSTGTLSSMKNLEDAYVIGDQFINDKSTDNELGKLNVEAEVISMVIVLIYQASSSVPLLSTPLVERVAALENKLSDLEQTNKNLDNTTRNLRSRVYTLELRDLPHKINEPVCENVKEAVQIALQDPLRDRFSYLSEEDMKEMLHQRMFKTGSYKSLPEHIRDEFLAEKDRSRKRCRDDQDPPPPPPDSDLSKRRRHDTGASGSLQPQSPQSSAWKKSDTRDAPSSSSKQQSGPHAKQPVKDVIPTSHIPDAENNWANALASTYQAPVKNSLLEKTRDMRTFMNWYCQKIGKTELTHADLEGQAYEVVKPFYPDVVHLQFQMEECHKMLTNQIDWANPEGDQFKIDISKPLPLSGPLDHMKAACYHDSGLELLVPEHMWIDDNKSLLSLRVHDYLKEITLRRADHQEYMIAKKDFKNLYPSDFEDLNLLILQGHLNYLPGSDIHMLSTAVKL